MLYLAGTVGGSPQLLSWWTRAPRDQPRSGCGTRGRYSAGRTASFTVARRIFPQQSFSFASTAYITRLSGHPTAGVLGQPQFLRYSLAVDFDRKQAALLSPEICPSSATRLPMFSAGGLPFVEGTISLAGGGSCHGTFPGGYRTARTGHRAGVGIFRRASRDGSWPRLERPATTTAAATTLVRLQELRLGPLTLHAPIAEVESAGAAAENPRLAGVLGLEALSRFNFVLNQRYASLYLEPNQRMHEPFEADMSGIVLTGDSRSQTVVTTVTPASPASDAGVQPGGYSRAYGRQTVDRGESGQRHSRSAQCAGLMCHLELERNGKPEQCHAPAEAHALEHFHCCCVQPSFAMCGFS